MHDLAVLFVHLITTVLRIAQPGGLRSVIAESVLIKHQLLIVNCSRRRAPNLRVWDRLIARLYSLWIRPHRLLRSAIAFKPSTLLNFHRALVQRKYRFLFSPKRRAKPGPKGLDQDLIRAVVDMKQRNPRWGCPRIAEQINLAFPYILQACVQFPRSNEDCGSRTCLDLCPRRVRRGSCRWRCAAFTYAGSMRVFSKILQRQIGLATSDLKWPVRLTGFCAGSWNAPPQNHTANAATTMITALQFSINTSLRRSMLFAKQV